MTAVTLLCRGQTYSTRHSPSTDEGYAGTMTVVEPEYAMVIRIRVPHHHDTFA